MAFINLLHNGYQGKLGETVGQKWKNQRTVRTYNPHNNSKSEAQLEQRDSYKTTIETASSCYPFLFGAQYVKPKKMNKFNAFTSTIDRIYRGDTEEAMKTGVFKHPTGLQVKPLIVTFKDKFYVIHDMDLNPTTKLITKLRVVAVLVKKTNTAVEIPIIDKAETRAFWAFYTFISDQLYTGGGPTFHIAGKEEDFKGSIVQFSFTYQGKECIQKPIVIGSVPAVDRGSLGQFGREYLVQTF